MIAVDVDGHPLRPRRGPIQAVADLASEGGVETVVAGDFNTPRRARSFDPLRLTHRNGFAAAGRGWAASWPAPLPVLDIDHVWLPRSIEPSRILCAGLRPAAGSDHRPLVVDLVVP